MIAFTHPYTFQISIGEVVCGVLELGFQSTGMSSPSGELTLNQGITH